MYKGVKESRLLEIGVSGGVSLKEVPSEWDVDN